MKWIIAALVVAIFAPAAEASWRTPVDGTKSGYCASAYPNKPTSFYWFKDVRYCPENRKNGTTRQNTPKNGLSTR